MWSDVDGNRSKKIEALSLLYNLHSSVREKSGRPTNPLPVVRSTEDALLITFVCRFKLIKNNLYLRTYASSGAVLANAGDASMNLWP